MCDITYKMKKGMVIIMKSMNIQFGFSYMMSNFVNSNKHFAHGIN